MSALPEGPWRALGDATVVNAHGNVLAARAEKMAKAWFATPTGEGGTLKPIAQDDVVFRAVLALPELVALARKVASAACFAVEVDEDCRRLGGDAAHALEKAGLR